MLWSYLKSQYKAPLLLCGTIGIFAAVFRLYDLPMEAVVYAGALCLVFGLILFAVGYGRFLTRHRELRRLLRRAGEKNCLCRLPEACLRRITRPCCGLCARTGPNSRRKTKTASGS